MAAASIESRENWETVGEIEIVSRLSLSDSAYFFDNPLLIAVDPGNYKLQIRSTYPEGHRHVDAIRVAQWPTEAPRGDMMGELLVDFGQIGICDRSGVERAFDTLGDEGMTQYFDQLNVTELFAWVTLPGATMAIIRPGFGSGMYPVYAIRLHDGRFNGIEIDCIPPAAEDE